MNAIARRSAIEVLAAAVPLAGLHVVDVGCGEGFLVRLMAKAGAHVIGVEPGGRMLELARAAAPVADEHYIEAPAEKLPLDDASADLVIFSNSLHHVPVPLQPRALAEAARVLKRDGALYVFEPIADGAFFEMTRLFNDETEVRAAALAALRDASRWGFEPVKESVYIQPMKARDFAAFKDRVITIEASRTPVFAAREAEIRAHFERDGRRVADGVEFDNPTRLSVLRKH